jgi:[acyl-carrier-protein] S-malonyltransferase
MTKLAYVFPGQGSQEVGMLREAESDVASLFKLASETLGYDLWSLVSDGPEDKLNQTEFTQPALLTASVALFNLAMQGGAPMPDLLAGHSLGEYSALVAAGVLEFVDAVSLVQKRGQFMQTAVPIGMGTMAAVLGLDDEKVREICAAASSSGVVQAANYNAPGQVVIAGHSAAVEDAIEACKEAGARRVMPLAVSAPFHSELMKPAAENMAAALAEVEFKASTTPIVQNVDASQHSSPGEIRENLVKQMYSAVLWTDTILNMRSDGVEIIVECGPGKVLSGLTRRIDKSMTSHNINSSESLASTLEALK